MEEDFKQEIIDKGQFPYKKRKYQYQSIAEENMVGIDIFFFYKGIALYL